MTQTHDARSRHLISTADLQARLASGAPTVVLDIRFRPDRPDGRPAYREGHIPGAVYVDLPTELAGEQIGFSGRRPLPDIHDLQRDARRWGIRQGSSIVVYDDNRGLQAGRGWWVLRWAGLTDVRVLDGGFDAWKAAGGAVTQDIPLPDHGDVVLEAGHLPVLTADGAAAVARQAVLIDARGPDAYRGDKAEPGKPAEGHIPGAINVPTSGNLTADGRFAEAGAIRDRFAALGIDGSQSIGVYCGGGVAAAHQILALATAGIDAALFPGSWSAWSSDPARPVATGSHPG